MKSPSFNTTRNIFWSFTPISENCSVSSVSAKRVRPLSSSRAAPLLSHVTPTGQILGWSFCVLASLLLLIQLTTCIVTIRHYALPWIGAHAPAELTRTGSEIWAATVHRFYLARKTILFTVRFVYFSLGDLAFSVAKEHRHALFLLWTASWIPFESFGLSLLPFFVLRVTLHDILNCFSRKETLNRGCGRSCCRTEQTRKFSPPQSPPTPLLSVVWIPRDNPLVFSFVFAFLLMRGRDLLLWWVHKDEPGWRPQRETRQSPASSGEPKVGSVILLPAVPESDLKRHEAKVGGEQTPSSSSTPPPPQ